MGGGRGRDTLFFPMLRVLVACSACGRQMDASGRSPGERFHCTCGGAVTVPQPRAEEAAVVRCSACGAPRQGKAARCGFCGSDFTLHERDLHTLCPGCMARISDRAAFCHRCGLGILPEETLGDEVERSCPACGGEARLTSRALGGPGMTVLECGRCAGLWVGRELFRRLEGRARDRALPWRPDGGGPEAARPPAEVVYRPCPECEKLMNRSNYGRRSGVVVDVCAAHGLWFDLGELDRVLAWIRDGGLDRALAAARERARAERARSEAAAVPPVLTAPARRGRTAIDLIEALVEFFAR